LIAEPHSAVVETLIAKVHSALLETVTPGGGGKRSCQHQRRKQRSEGLSHGSTSLGGAPLLDESSRYAPQIKKR
jgi:hypothetical protein